MTVASPRIEIGIPLKKLLEISGITESCDMVEDCARLSRDRCHVRVAKPGSGLHQSIEHGPEIERRAADDLEHISSGGLLLERFESSRVRV